HRLKSKALKEQPKALKEQPKDTVEQGSPGVWHGRLGALRFAAGDAEFDHASHDGATFAAADGGIGALLRSVMAERRPGKSAEDVGLSIFEAEAPGTRQ